ncbi:MAG TPA: hypothetical protein VHS29_00985, partial [Candidatus Acidoferrales bacterium]|nr:hypothetical protein [Candidatus Acidoferrales bacterium]
MIVAAETGISPPPPARTRITSRVQAMLRSASAQPLGRMAGMVAIYSLLALVFIRNFHIGDPDIWWHLATGRWILQHRAIPMTDPFSSYGMGKPWIAY